MLYKTYIFYIDLISRLHILFTCYYDSRSRYILKRCVEVAEVTRNSFVKTKIDFITLNNINVMVRRTTGRQTRKRETNTNMGPRSKIQD